MAENIEISLLSFCNNVKSKDCANSSCRNIFKKFLAFTLAETLIVMGIIGIVSALTLPNLNSSTGEKEKVAKLKKIYQNLNDAVGRSAAVYGPVDENLHVSSGSDSALMTKIGDRFTEFLKVSKNCGTSTDKGCFSNGKYLYDYRSGDSPSTENLDSMSYAYKFVLADGSSVAIVLTLGGPMVYVNLDGPTKRPVLGKNTFVFLYDYDGSIWKDDIVTRWASLTEDDLLESCFSEGNCSDWVIRNENLDYLKTDENGKCPNGKVLNYTTNTTCK